MNNYDKLKIAQKELNEYILVLEKRDGPIHSKKVASSLTKVLNKIE